MNRDELKALHEIATEARDLAHQAYTIALKNRVADGDTEAAYHALLKANRVRDRIYAAILALAVEPTPAPEPVAPELFRVVYTTSGGRRRTKTVNRATLDYARNAWHVGIRVTSFRPATEAEIKRGAYAGSLNM